MANLNLHYVDELIGARQEQHGGGRGAPALAQPDIRQGASINRSCIVMLSAQLQVFVEEVFKECAVSILPTLANAATMETYWKQMNRWGNPNSGNIKNLFLRVGVPDVLDGLSWQNCTNEIVRGRLDSLNQVRNKIAHGDRQLRVNGAAYPLSLKKVIVFRNFARNFGDRFETHARNLVSQ